jgi:NADH dehydrogenase [ubiquinone] 1 alpha subcomplex assembly factor 6
VYSGTVTEGLRDVTLKVASTAKGHLDEARLLQAKLPDIAKHLMLTSLAVDGYLKALEAKNFDPFDQSLIRKGGAASSPLWHVLRVKWHLWSKSY